MTSAEERYQVIMTYCNNIGHTAKDIDILCDILLADSNGFFSEAQVNAVTSIHKAAQTTSLLAETAKANVSDKEILTTEEFRFCMACFLNDMRGYLPTINGFAQISLEGKFGRIGERQQKIMKNIEQLGRSLNVTSNEFIDFLRTTKD